jgi:hypothetical protein
MRKRTYSREARRLQPFVAQASGDVSTIVVEGATRGVSVPQLRADFDAHDAASAAAAHAGGVGAHAHQDDPGGGQLDHGLALSGLGDDDHPQYLLADGTRALAGSLLPAVSDTYDLGDPSHLIRKIWASELDAVVFAQNSITLLGGWFMVTKNQGTLAADVTAAATQIDFGTAMTAGDFVLLRSSLQVEYLQVGTLVSGTTYNVTRNLDGTGANDWPAGSVFAVLGQLGDGRIEMSAYTTPRIRVGTQGATYNAVTDWVAIGDLNGTFGVGSETYGLGVGDYAGGNYMIYNPPADEPFQIHAGNGGVTLGNSGLTMQSVGQPAPGPSYYDEVKSVKFMEGANLTAALWAWKSGSGYKGFEISVPPEVGHNSWLTIATEAPSGSNALTKLQATSGSNSCSVTVEPAEVEISGGNLSVYGNGIRLGMSYHAVGNGDIYAEGDITVDGNITVGGTLTKSGRTGYIFVPLTTPLTSTAWDGDARSTTDKTLIDLSAVFGAPAGVKAILAWVEVKDSGSASGDCWICLSPNATAYSGLYASPYGNPNDVPFRNTMTIPCNANGDIYYQTLATGSGTLDVVIHIWGYYM